MNENQQPEPNNNPTGADSTKFLEAAKAFGAILPSEQQTLDKLNVAKALIEVVEESEKINYAVDVQEISQEHSPFPSPGKVGYLPHIEKQIQVRAALTGKPSPRPTRYAEPEEPVQKIVTRQEIKHGIPYARCIVFLDATIEGLFSADKKQRALEQATNILKAFSEVKNAISEVPSRSLECYLRVQTVAGTAYAFSQHQFPPSTERTTQKDTELYIQNLPDVYTKATKRTIGLPSDVGKENIESIDFEKDPLSNNNRAWMQAPESIGEQAFGYAPAVVAITIAPGKEIQITKLPGKRIPIPEKK